MQATRPTFTGRQQPALSLAGELIVFARRFVLPHFQVVAPQLPSGCDDCAIALVRAE